MHVSPHPDSDPYYKPMDYCKAPQSCVKPLKYCDTFHFSQVTATHLNQVLEDFIYGCQNFKWVVVTFGRQLWGTKIRVVLLEDIGELQDDLKNLTGFMAANQGWPSPKVKVMCVQTGLLRFRRWPLARRRQRLMRQHRWCRCSWSEGQTYQTSPPLLA